MFQIIRLAKRKVAGVVSEVKQVGIETTSAALSFLLHLRYSFKERRPDKDVEQLKYYLIKHCHIVEKGMSLPTPRPAFGQPKIVNIIRRARKFELMGGEKVPDIVRDTLRAYRRIHKGRENLFSKEFLGELDSYVDASVERGKGGLLSLKKGELHGLSFSDFERFVGSRHSVRDFSNVPVSEKLVFSAIKSSLRTPSVCNRQGWSVHYYDCRKRMDEILLFQNGNLGFTASIDKLLLITGNVKAFTTMEHSQLFVDGGLFAMNLMLGLHAHGLGSCPLNTCMSYGKELRLKRTAGIPAHQRLIMMLAVGNLKDEFAVAQSERFGVDDVLVRH